MVELDGVIGDLMLAIEDAWAQAEVADQARGVQAELGWCIDPACSSPTRTEAVGALVRLCFEDLGLRRVTANCFADNVSSWRLMERLGMRREVHTRRESLHRSGSGWTAWATPSSPTSGAADRPPPLGRALGAPYAPPHARPTAVGGPTARPSGVYVSGP